MSKKKTQKVLIPKGTIDPNEDTLIEIPVNLKDQPVVVAKRTDGTKSIGPTALQLAEDSLILSTSRNQTKLRTQQRNNESFSPSLSSTFYESSDLYQTAPPIASNLDETEITERKIIQKKLEDFQHARRELLLGTSSVATKSSQIIPSSVNYENDPNMSRYSSRLKSNFRHHSSYEPEAGLNTACVQSSSATDYEDVVPSAPTKTCIKSTRSSSMGSEDESAPAIQSIYVRPNSSCYGKSRRSDMLAPQDSYILAKKYNAASGHRKYEKYKSRQCKQVQTEVNIDEDDEEEDSCLCLSKSTNSFSKSASSYSTRRR